MKSKILTALLALVATLSANAQYMGDYAVGTDNICRYFRTAQPSTGASFTIVSEAVDVYSDDSATQDADDSGLTLDDDFDSVTGFHQICVDTSSDGTFYSAGKTFTVMLSGGTVDSVAVTGTPILIFTLAKGVLAAGAITATVLATDAIGDAEVATGAIAATAFAAGAIDAAAIATDAIGAAELAAGAIAAAEIATDAIDDDAIATDAIAATALAANSITSSEIADDAVDAGAIAANALTTAEIATGAISADEVADDAIDAGAMAAAALASDVFATTAGSFNALGIVDQGTAQSATGTTLVLRSAATFADDELNGNEILITGGSAGVGQTRLITDYVSSSDTATVATWTTTPSGTITYQVRTDTATGGSVSIGVGGIAANSFAAGAIDATAIATGAVDADAVADNALDAGAFASNALTDAKFNSAAGTFYALGVIDQGTAQSATSTTLVLRSAAAFANDEVIGATCLITGGSTGVGQSRTITDYVSSTDTATVDAWTTTPTGTIEYKCWGTAPGGAGSTLTQADVRTAIGMASANMDTQLAAIDDAVDTEVAAILVDTGTTLDDLVDDLESRLGTPSNLGGGATVAFNLSDIEGQTDDIGAAGAGLTAADDAVLALVDDIGVAGAGLTAADDAVMTRLGTPAGASVSADIAAIEAQTDDIGAAGAGLTVLATQASVDTVDNFLDTEITALMNARTQIFPGNADADSVLTADSGDTNTLVDTELTFSAAQDIDAAYVVRSDGQRCEIDSFTPATDTIEFGACTFTGAWSTQTYKIYPANTQ